MAPFVRAAQPVWAWLQQQAEGSPRLGAVRQVHDLCLEMANSRVSLSQGGYNTAMDILRSRTPAVVVPFSEGSEDEQRRRTERLAALGILRLLPAEELPANRLVEELVAAAALRPASVSLDLDGAATTAALLAQMAAVAPPSFAGSTA